MTMTLPLILLQLILEKAALRRDAEAECEEVKAQSQALLDKKTELLEGVARLKATSKQAQEDQERCVHTVQSLQSQLTQVRQCWRPHKAAKFDHISSCQCTAAA